MAEANLGEAAGIAAALTAIGGWLLKALIGREVARMDSKVALVDSKLEQHDTRIRGVENAAAESKMLLSNIQAGQVQDRQEQSEYHKERMEEIRRVHQRLDTLLERDGK